MEKPRFAVCQLCGKEFGHGRRPSYLAERRFCSRKCAAIHNQTPDPSKRSIFTCKWCSKDFEEWTYRNPSFCSSQCRSEYGARQPKPNLRKPEIHVLLCCEQCGSEFKTTTTMIRLRNPRFCSRMCGYQWVSENVVGENHPRFKANKTNTRGLNWHSQRRKALERDGHKCQICGTSKKGFKRRWTIEVHHIKPYVSFGGDFLAANELSNLITLCKSCHNKVEHHGLPCPQRLL